MLDNLVDACMKKENPNERLWRKTFEIKHQQQLKTNKWLTYDA